MKKKAADDMVEALKKEIMKKVNYLNSHGSCRILCSHWNVNCLPDAEYFVLSFTHWNTANCRHIVFTVDLIHPQ